MTITQRRTKVAIILFAVLLVANPSLAQVPVEEAENPAEAVEETEGQIEEAETPTEVIVNPIEEADIPAELVESPVDSSQSRTEAATWRIYDDWELEMKSYNKDSSAIAVILYDAGVMDFSGKKAVLFKHRRVKILDESAYDEYATISIPYSSHESISDLEARIIYIDEYGTEVTQVLGSTDFIVEQLSEEFRQTTFTFPNVRPGAIVEYRYNMAGRVLFEWVFDNEVPTLWSAYSRIAPAVIDFALFRNGAREFHHILNTSFKISFSIEGELAYSQGLPLGNKTDIWVMKDLPAFEEEGFMAPAALYRNRIGYFAKSQYIGPNTDRHFYFKDWQTETDDYITYLEEVLKTKWGIKRQVATTIELAGAVSDEEKMIALYNYVRDHIETDLQYSGHVLVGENTPKVVLETGKGSSTAKNVLLLSMLKAAGLTSFPTLVKLRSEGPLHKDIETFLQFDRVLATLKMNDEFVFLDATELKRPWHMIAVEDMVEEALVLYAGRPEFVNLRGEEQISHKAMVTATIDEDNIFRAEIQTIDDSYKALGLRVRYDANSGSDNEFVQDFILDNLVAGEIESTIIENATSDQLPFKTKTTITAEEFVQEAGDRMFISPMIFGHANSSAFSEETRKLDFDFVFQPQQTYVFSLTIPDGYVVDELPENKQVSILGNAIAMNRSVFRNGNTIQYIIQERWRESYFSVDNYDELKTYINQMIALQDDVIVLKSAGGDSTASTQNESETDSGDTE